MNEFQLPIKITWETLNKRLGPLYQYISPITVNDSTILLNPTGAKTMCVIEGIIDSATVTDVYFKVNPITEQAIGNQLFLISKPNSTADDIIFHYDNTQFYLTMCGSPEIPPSTKFSEGLQERDVTIFTFDGEVWVATYDNC
jgi:hypothetical protein